MKKKLIIGFMMFVMAILFIVIGVILFNSVPNTTTTPIEDAKVFDCICIFAIGLACLSGSLIVIFND